jgi:hypothetical protein
MLLSFCSKIFREGKLTTSVVITISGGRRERRKREGGAEKVLKGILWMMAFLMKTFSHSCQDLNRWGQQDVWVCSKPLNVLNVTTMPRFHAL